MFTESKELRWWSAVNSPPANAGDVGSIPGSGSSPGGGHGNPLQYSCLRNHMDRGAWWVTVQGVTACLLGIFRHAATQRQDRKKNFF